MSKGYLTSLVVCILLVWCEGQVNRNLGGRPGNPGFQIRITRKGLDYANMVAGRILNTEVRRRRIPDIRKGIKGGYVEAKNIRITEFHPLRYKYNLRSPNRLGWSTEGGRVKIEGRFRAKKKWGWFLRIRKSGSFSVTASDIRLSISAAFYNSGGQPQLRHVQCHAHFGHMDARLRAGILGWIINRFRGPIIRRMKPKLQDQVCQQAKKFIKMEVNKKLSTFKTRMPLGTSGYMVDYSLTSDPNMRNGILSSHRGTLRDTNSRPASFYPAAMQVSSSNSKMFYLYGSDYILNSFLSHAHRQKMTSHTVANAKFLRWSCGEIHEICLGNIPGLADKYSNTKPSISFWTTAAPTVVFGYRKATVRAAGKVSLDVQQRGRYSRPTRVLTANVSISAHLTPTVTNEKITAVLHMTNFDISGLHSTVVDVSEDSALRDTVAVLDLKLPLQNMANQHLKEGIAIPVTQGIHLRNFGLQLLPRTLELSADVNYAG